MNAPRILPLVGIAVGGVLAIKALSGVTHLPDLVEGAKAFAEGVAPTKTQDAGKPDPNAPVLPPGLSPKAAPQPGSAEAVAAAANTAPQAPRLACGPNPADLARDAGLSPAELQVLQSLSARRGQLDQRQQDLDVQLQLLSAAETKLDSKLRALASMKADLQKLLDDADQKKVSEIDRLVTVYSQMKPKDAAARMSLLDDGVRLPIAAKMKERALSAILAQMAPADAKSITEKLAGRFESKVFSDARSAIAGQPAAGAAAQTAATPPAPAAQAAAPATAPAAPPPRPARVARARPHRKSKAAALAANTTAPPTPEREYAKPPPSPAPGAAAPAKAGAAPAKTG
jgi:flagellar motility protein MotE (MotC chaperone)